VDVPEIVSTLLDTLLGASRKPLSMSLNIFYNINIYLLNVTNSINIHIDM